MLARILLIAAIASTLMMLPGAATVAQAAGDPLLRAQLPHKLKVISVTGTRHYALSGTDAQGDHYSSSEHWNYKLGSPNRAFITNFPTVNLTGPIEGLATTTLMNCPWSYTGADVGTTSGLLFERLGRRYVRVTLSHSVPDPIKFSAYLSSHTICNNNALAGGTFAQSIPTNGGLDACGGAEMCRKIRRSVLNRSSFSLRFTRIEPLRVDDTQETSSIVSDVTYSFKRV